MQMKNYIIVLGAFDPCLDQMETQDQPYGCMRSTTVEREITS